MFLYKIIMYELKINKQEKTKHQDSDFQLYLHPKNIFFIKNCQAPMNAFFNQGIELNNAYKFQKVAIIFKIA